jgi:hypothetical protein
MEREGWTLHFSWTGASFTFLLSSLSPSVAGVFSFLETFVFVCVVSVWFDSLLAL